MPIEYEDLKSLARQIGRPVKDLLALAPGNDPFYAGVPYRRRQGEWFRDLWDRFQFPDGVHLRRIHYVLVSMSESGEEVLRPDGEPYLNTDNDWHLLDKASLAARYLDLVPADAFVDRRNSAPQIFTPEDALNEYTLRLDNTEVEEGYFADFPDLPDLDFRLHPDQDYLAEVWVEKSSQNDWLVPLCEARKVNLVVGIGELSEVACRQLVQRAQHFGKPTRILYISDFDPGGRSMPVAAARKIEFNLLKFDIETDVTLQPIILTEDQCQDYRLPRTPIKDSERRKDKFEDRFGAGATELDALEALHPGEMKRIVDEEISRYIDPTLLLRSREVEWAVRDQLREIKEVVLDDYDGDVERLRQEHDGIVDQLSEFDAKASEVWSAIAVDLDARAPDPKEIEKPKPRPAQEPEGPVLFDSKRDPLRQLDHYHDWQRR
jgi:hypothetical protein